MAGGLFCSSGGCTAKLGPDILERVLSRIERGAPDKNLLVGFDSSDDAAVYRVSDDVAVVQTLDFFPPMLEDPYVFGQIAATNALSDVYAMGGEVISALNIVCFPQDEDLNVLGEIMRGGSEKVVEAGAVLCGGHSINDKDVKYGLSVNGVVHPDRIYKNNGGQAGDVLIGMASTGVHSNGFSLVRKVFDMTKESLDTYYDELGKTLGEALLAPTRIYVKAMKSVKNAGVKVKGCSHITGGGFYENIPRMLPDGIRAVVKKDSYEVPAIFRLMQKKGNIADEMMYNTYNMGLGMVLALDPADVDKTLEALKAAGETAYVVGTCEAGEKGVTIC